ncbi:hypothetical protein B0I37DRAFT_443332 [Chaetomium sp. MPI-CAGE-AT-0009]|nr:hypothetical protein B0I37DRAFT_443332 [Chaetomium sp. MPI-CAGE-AT-0009]
MVERLVSRRLTEYVLPVATETHELAHVPGTNLLLVTQLSDSRLVKIKLNRESEPHALNSFLMGRNSGSGLHGVWPSARFTGLVWLALQNENKLLLVDPGEDLETAPTIIKTIDIPKPGNGRTACTGKYYVFSADVDNYYNITRHKLYECHESPLFIAEEPNTGLIYVTQDAESSIMQINVDTGKTAQFRIPSCIGNTPVGMTTASGPLSGLWFSLAGDANGGTGSFGHIGASGEPRFFRLRQPLLGANAGLLHIADASTAKDGPALWLLSTSLFSTNSADALIRVAFNATATAVTGEEYAVMPTQNSMVHRILPLHATVLVTELHTFKLAQLRYVNTDAGKWVPAEDIPGIWVMRTVG